MNNLNNILLKNMFWILLASAMMLRAIIAVPLALAATENFSFLIAENKFLNIFIAIVSMVAIEVIMTLFSLLTATFRQIEMKIGYWVSLAFVLMFWLLNAILILDIKNIYPTVPNIAIFIFQSLNIASVVLSEAIGFIKNEKASNKVILQIMKNDIPAEILSIKNSNLSIEEKVLKIHAIGFFKTQVELANFLVTNQPNVSRILKGN